MWSPGIHMSITEDVSQIRARQPSDAGEVATNEPPAPAVRDAAIDNPGHSWARVADDTRRRVRDSATAAQGRDAAEQPANVKGLSGYRHGGGRAERPNAPKGLIDLLAGDWVSRKHADQNCSANRRGQVRCAPTDRKSTRLNSSHRCI